MEGAAQAGIVATLSRLRHARDADQSAVDYAFASFVALAHGLSFSTFLMRVGPAAAPVFKRSWYRSAGCHSGAEAASLDRFDYDGVIGASRSEDGKTILVRSFSPLGQEARCAGVVDDTLDDAALDSLFLATTHCAAVFERANKPARGLLTQRELAVVELAAQGMKASAAADALGIAEATVKFRLANARKKLSARNKTETIARAAALGLISPASR